MSTIDKENITENKSHSQVKREQRKKEIAKARRSAATGVIIGWVFILAFVALIGWGVASLVKYQLDKVEPDSNYSDGLDEKGYIKGVNASSKVTLPNYKGIEIPRTEIEYSEESIDEDIASLLEDNKELSTDESLVINLGDTVDIGYVGSIDGVEFDGGAADSYDLEIGSNTFIDGFEEALIGHANMSSFDITVTFPEEYGSADLAGKEAVFAITVNGIYAVPEFTDEYVAENYGDEASTVEEYRANIKAENEKSNIKEWVENYLVDNTTVKSYPSKFVRILKSIQLYDDQQTYEYMNQMYSQFYGYSPYSSFSDYTGMSDEEYKASLKPQAEDRAKELMVYQAIVETEGAVADAAYYKDFLVREGQDEANYDALVASQGEPAALQEAIKEKALEIVLESVVVK